MSRFVQSGTADAPIERDEAWLKAQREIESKRKAKEDIGRQADGKSLYETLQANKGGLSFCPLHCPVHEDRTIVQAALYQSPIVMTLS